MKEIYFPASCRVLTVGHIKCLEYLKKQGYVTIGLLTAKAMKGYKKELMPFKERKLILELIGMALGSIDVVAQDSLDPTENIKRLKPDAIASGDGWEPLELAAIKKFRLDRIDILLPGEKKKKHSSSDILDKNVV